MENIFICRRCGDRRLPPPHDWAGEHDRFPGESEPQPGGLGWGGDMHDWSPPRAPHHAHMDSRGAGGRLEELL